MDIFNLKGEKSIKEEEEAKMSGIKRFIERLKLNKIITRY